ncbi:MAG: hypothetical protein K2J73_10525 [Oscillospiraceae bacterium]|nr:hypothetical protein [Oscillospiraceae bacterium]
MTMFTAVPCGYMEMYQGADESDRIKLPVHMDSQFLIEPEGAHLNISGISGLAAKTSYAMFLLKAIQDKCLGAVDKDANDVAFVIFNVKGKDLLAIDEPNPFESDEKRRETHALYEAMGMSTSPFKNVHYYYPYSKKGAWNTYLDQATVESNIKRGAAHMYKYECRFILVFQKIKSDTKRFYIFHKNRPLSFILHFKKCHFFKALCGCA